MLSDATKQVILNLPVILSIKEIACFFQVTYLTVLREIYRKKLAAYKDDEGVWCVLRGDLLKYCSKNCNL